MLESEYIEIINSKTELFYRFDFVNEKAILNKATITINDVENLYQVHDSSKDYENCDKTFENFTEAVDFLKNQNFIQIPNDFDEYNFDSILKYKDIINNELWIKNKKEWIEYYQNS